MARTKEFNKRERRVRDYKHPRKVAQRGASSGETADVDSGADTPALVADSALEGGALEFNAVEDINVAAPLPYRLKEPDVSLGGPFDFTGSDHAVTASTDALKESAGYDESATLHAVLAYASSLVGYNASQIDVYESDEESETDSHDDRAGVYMRENSEYSGVVTFGPPVSLDEAYHMTASPDYSHLTPANPPPYVPTRSYIAVRPSSPPPKFKPVTDADGDKDAQIAILTEQLSKATVCAQGKCLEITNLKRQNAQKEDIIKQKDQCNLVLAEENVKLTRQQGRRPTTMQMFGLVRQM